MPVKPGRPPNPIAGFPYFQLDRFLKILVQDLNKYVAIVEEYPVSQNTNEKTKDGHKFERRVARVVTPGTLIDEKFLDPDKNNFLLAVHFAETLDRADLSGVPLKTITLVDEKVGLAWLDLTTGEFFTQVTRRTLLPSSLARIGAREVIIDEALSEPRKREIELLVTNDHRLLTIHTTTSDFVAMSEWNGILESPVAKEVESTFTPEEKHAGHCLLDYVRNRLQGQDMTLKPPMRKEVKEALGIDRNSLRGLEVLETARDGLGKGSVLHAVRRTTTKSGARLLRDRLVSPSASLPEINERLDLVSSFHLNTHLRDQLIEQLAKTSDVQRLVQKFTLNRGDADDMVSLTRAIGATASVERLLRSCLDGTGEGSTLANVPSLQRLLDRIDLSGPTELGQRIANAIDEEGLNQKHRLEEDEASNVAAEVQKVILGSQDPSEIEAMPVKVKTNKKCETKEHDLEIEEPWIMRRSASETIGRLHKSLDELKQEKTAMTQELKKGVDTELVNLKWTAGLGHIVHLKSNKLALRTFVQEKLHGRIVGSTKSTMSFYYTEWSRLGGRTDQARVHIRNEELRIFSTLRQEVIKNLIQLRRNAAVMDELDVACSFATLAEEQSLVRPILNTGLTHKIVGGRHPTVKLGLEESGRSFVSNDLFLGDNERIWLVTGPNMAGKSTFLRQNALISILAQVGSYVPAEHAEIGLVDQIFSRIGAADDLFRDQSTFMVEMLETAAILKQATPRSFVIMDEVGRGTTPEDGTAVGYACLHHLYHVNKCRTLFATHFHALADMTEDMRHLGRYCTDVLEDPSGSFSFVHRLRAGVNRRSHALKVARLAGLPEPALEVAGAVLRRLHAEKDRMHGPSKEEETTLAAAMG
jgi:DNA mismatch repair ATPase MutS